MAALTLSQMTEAVAVLARSVQPPFQNDNQTGLYVNTANQLTIPLNTNNSTLGTNFASSTDGTYVYLTLNFGDPASGA